jgi:hypothetical protein
MFSLAFRSGVRSRSGKRSRFCILWVSRLQWQPGQPEAEISAQEGRGLAHEELMRKHRRRRASTVLVPPRSNAMPAARGRGVIAAVRRQAPCRRSLARVRPWSELPLDKGSPPFLEKTSGLHDGTNLILLRQRSSRRDLMRPFWENVYPQPPKMIRSTGLRDGADAKPVSPYISLSP